MSVMSILGGGGGRKKRKEGLPFSFGGGRMRLPRVVTAALAACRRVPPRGVPFAAFLGRSRDWRSGRRNGSPAWRLCGRAPTSRRPPAARARAVAFIFSS